MDRIKEYLNERFSQLPPTPQAVELRDEMAINLNEKYEDLLRQGYGEDRAFQMTVGSVGDLSELFASLSIKQDEKEVFGMEQAKKKSAMLTAIAVMLYILSPVFIILLGSIGAPIPGLTLMFLSIAAATGLLVYNHMTRPRYLKKDDKMVEEFKEWSSEKTARKEARSAVSSALWMLTVAGYFVISFLSGAWHISWIIFLVGAALQSLLNALFASRQ
jgi:hypothetical protein